MQTVSASNVAVVGLSTAGECPVNSETPKSEAFDAMNSSKSASEKKKETDCWFFLNAECTKKETCEFRHSEVAKSNPKVCRNWMKSGQCEAGANCTFRHPSKLVPPFGQEKVKIPCTFFMKGECWKGEHCPYLHQIPRQFVYINPQLAAKSSPSEETSVQKQDSAKMRETAPPLPPSTTTITANNTPTETATSSTATTAERSTTARQISSSQSHSDLQNRKPPDRLAFKTPNPKGTTVKLASAPNTTPPFRVKTLEELLKEEEDQKKQSQEVEIDESNPAERKNHPLRTSAKTADNRERSQPATKRSLENAHEEATAKRSRQSTTETTTVTHSKNELTSQTNTTTTTTDSTSMSTTNSASTTRTFPTYLSDILTESEISFLMSMPEEDNDNEVTDKTPNS